MSNSAFTQRRAQLKHTAFIELNQKAIVDVVYSEDNFKRYKGMRILAIDGSKTVLPYTADVINEFGQISYKSPKIDVEGAYACAMASVLYDVLNRIAVDSKLAPAKAYEVDLAVGHLEYTQEQDLLITDRNYPSYRWLAEVTRAKRHFLSRCSAASFGVARKMLTGEGADSQIVTLTPPNGKLKETRELNLPEQLKVRFVRVLLETGEYEVLVTSLMDAQEFPTEDFKALYYLRWGEETFFGILKTRLNLENFTGKTAESVYQDFYASIYLTGMESILTADVDKKLAEKLVQHKQQVNRAVSFNAIKNHALELLYSDEDNELILKKLTALFLTNPTVMRKSRKVPRKKRSAGHLLDYVRRRYKICF